MTEVFKNYIGGKWMGSASGKTFERRNPANGELVGTFTKSNHVDVDAAVKAAKRAYADWRLFPAPKRGEILFSAAQLLVERKEQLARAAQAWACAHDADWTAARFEAIYDLIKRKT